MESKLPSFLNTNTFSEQKFNKEKAGEDEYENSLANRLIDNNQTFQFSSNGDSISKV